MFQAKIDLESGELITPLQKLLDKIEPEYPKWITGEIRVSDIINSRYFYSCIFLFKLPPVKIEKWTITTLKNEV